MTKLLHRLAYFSGVLGLCWCLAPVAAAPQPDAGSWPKKLTIDRLYRFPWLIGTRPESPTWSPNSQKVAFLWNDDGTNFHDLWLTDRSQGKPVRVTDMPRPANPADADQDIAKLQAQARAETDRGISEVIWSPDGSSLLFNFHGDLYQVIPGQPARRLVDGVTALSGAAAAPEGNRVAYLAQGKLWVMTLGGSIPSTKAIYAPTKKDVMVEAFRWSNDGKQLAFILADASRVPTRIIPDYLGDETTLKRIKRPFPGEPSEARRVGIISAEGGKVRWAELGADPLDLIFGISWSPDSKTILVDKSDLTIKDRRLLLVDSRTGQARILLRELDPKNVTAEWWSDWAPDGNGVYFMSDRDNDYHLYYESVAGGEPKPITAGNFAVFSASLSPAGKALFVVTNQGKLEERHLFRLSLAGGDMQRITDSPGTHSPVPSPDGLSVADIFSSDGTPPDLYLIQAPMAPGTDRSIEQVTHSPLPEFKDYQWVTAKYVDFPNVLDGTLLHARLTLPPDFDPSRKYPAILGSVYSNCAHNQWGGRIFHPTWGLDQYLAQQGFVILNVDISGSSGYGKIFRQRIGLDYGGVDVEDLYSGVAYLVGQGWVDADRVGIWGSSYGGLLTTMSLFTRPGIYRAGVAGAPATSLFHAQTGEMRTMMAPQDHRQQYEKSSAFLQSAGLQDHLMIIHGMRDDTVLFKDSIALEQRLILQGKDVDLVVLPDAPHGWDTQGLAQTRFAFNKLVAHFQKFLGAKTD